MPTSTASPCLAPLTEAYPSASRPLTSGVPGRDEPVVQAPTTLRAFADARVYAPAQTPVVLSGATGTGKAYLARFIHRVSSRRNLPFVSRTAAESTIGSVCPRNPTTARTHRVFRRPDGSPPQPSAQPRHSR